MKGRNAIPCRTLSAMSSSAVILWGRTNQGPMMREALRRSDLTPVAAGSARQADAAELAKAGRAVVTTEPHFGALADLAASPELGLAMTFVPLMRRSPGFRAATDSLPQFGEVQCVNIFFRCGPGQGTLYARLFDAMEVLHSLCGQPETINAAASGPLPDVPDSLAAMQGHMTINMRFKPNRCACIALSDSAGSWFRGVTVLGEGGCLRISDDGFEWIGQDGRLIDQHREEDPLSPGELIGMQIARLREDLDQSDPPINALTLVSLCEAARLSCLTGQDEAPGKLVDMLSRP
jgi:hypothetical protein